MLIGIKDTGKPHDVVCKPQSAPAVQNEEADFTVVDRRKKIKVSRERHESKQQAQRGTSIVDGPHQASQSVGSRFQCKVLQ